MAESLYLPIISLNVNVLNAPIKRRQVADWIKKKKARPIYFSAYKRLISELKHTRMNVRGWKKMFHANRNDQKAAVAMLISDKTDFKTKSIKKDKEGHSIMIKRPVRKEDIKFINTYAPNIGALKYIKQILSDIEGEIENKLQYNNRRL